MNIFRKPAKIAVKQLLPIACVAVVMLVTVLLISHVEPTPYFEQQIRASETYSEALHVIRDYKKSLGISIHSEDYLQSGLIGEAFTPLTTTLGDPAAKRTAAQPDMAALLVRLYHEAGLTAGDTVVANLSGSFPGLNIATLIACDVMNLHVIYTASYGSSMYGATDVSAPELIQLLYDADLITTLPATVSIGGDADIGGELEKEFRDALKQELETSNIPFLYESDFERNENQRLTVYESNGPISLFVSVGGHTSSIGETSNQLTRRQGLISPASVPHLSGDGLLVHFLSKGVPVIQLLNIKQLVNAYGLPFDPMSTVSPGTSAVYFHRNYPVVLIVASLILLVGLLIGSILWTRRRNQDLTNI